MSRRRRPNTSRLMKPTLSTQLKSKAQLSKRYATAELKLADASLRPRTSQTRALYQDDAILHAAPAPATGNPVTKPRNPRNPDRNKPKKRKKKKVVLARNGESPHGQAARPTFGSRKPLYIDTNRMLEEAMLGAQTQTPPTVETPNTPVEPSPDVSSIEEAPSPQAISPIATRSLTAENLKALEKLTLEERIMPADNDHQYASSAVSTSLEAPSMTTYAMTSVSQRALRRLSQASRDQDSTQQAYPTAAMGAVQERAIPPLPALAAVDKVNDKADSNDSPGEFDLDEQASNNQEQDASSDDEPQRAALVVRRSTSISPQRMLARKSSPSKPAQPPPASPSSRSSRRRSRERPPPLEAISEKSMVVTTDFTPSQYSPKPRRSRSAAPSFSRAPRSPGSIATRTSRASRSSKTSKGVPRKDLRLLLVKEMEHRLASPQACGPLKDCVSGFELTKQLQKAADDLRQKGKRITDGDISELSGYRNPRAEVLAIMAAFVSIVAAPLDWTSLEQTWDVVRLHLKSRRLLPKLDEFDVRIGVPLGAVAIEATADLQPALIVSESKAVSRVLAWLHAYGKLVLAFEETIEEVRRRNAVMSSCGMTKQDIREIKTTKQASKLTHALLKHIASLVALHRNRDASHFSHWGSLQQYLRSSFEADLLAFDIDAVPADALLALAERISQESETLDMSWQRISRCSAAIVGGTKWLQAQLGYLPLSQLISA
eukprot:TRINITY_DN10891_c0_g1_i3.p1 TRINITY_DN10891_c0_g1~~TRINITY_DN10891_c0_g1_i3.p1  ORF type:complete len:717 (+),score=122.28 TRINITY_DN10891_c0_g1_i3:47-2197(+)